MQGGAIFAYAVIYAALAAFGSWLLWMISTAQDMRRDEHSEAWGDWPKVPTDFRGGKARTGMTAGEGGQDRHGPSGKHTQHTSSGSDFGTGAQ